MTSVLPHPRSFPCPYCGAQPGEDCRSGRGWTAGNSHLNRRRQAEDALREITANAWDEGYAQGIRDQEQDVQHGADNPYRNEGGS